MAVLLAAAVCANGQSQITPFKAVLDGVLPLHEINNYFLFQQRAPADWANYVAGPSDDGTVGLNWSDVGGPNFLRNAANNGFDLVYMYEDGTVDPDFVDYAAQHGCAVITKYGSSNEVILVDYRGPGSAIQAMGPTPLTLLSVNNPAPLAFNVIFPTAVQFVKSVDEYTVHEVFASPLMLYVNALPEVLLELGATLNTGKVGFVKTVT